MAKNFEKTSAASTVASQQEDQLWTLARRFGTPVQYHKEWEETAHPIGVPERLLVFTRDSQDFILVDKPKRQSHHFVLIIVLKGSGQICVDERIFRLDAGQALLIFPFQFRHFISLQERSIRWIFISFEIPHANSLESLRNHPWLLTPKSAQILHHLLEAAYCRISTRTTTASEAQLWLAHLLHQGSAQEKKPSSSSPPIFTDFQRWLERIHGYLYRHINQPFKLEDMAHDLGCSESYLRHQFKRYFKMSLGHYVAQMRLKKATGLLHENTLNISGVAQACGYGSVYAFSHTFRAVMGCSPRDYRIQNTRENTGR